MVEPDNHTAAIKVIGVVTHWTHSLGFARLEDIL
jgi:hypothetical protein